MDAALPIGSGTGCRRVDLRPAGRFRLRGQCTVDGEVLEVSAPSSFKWTWPHADHPGSEVRITILKPGDDASRVTLVQSNLPARHLLDVAAGWHTHLDALPKAIVGERTPFDIDSAATHYRRYAAAIGASAAGASPDRPRERDTAHQGNSSTC
ncbi:MAG: SRPBCC domain-containing protein [Dehalococcoidia bacterium]|nr:SRPBCC domain-containing protein [Dehalococcoidia bacterium]